VPSPHALGVQSLVLSSPKTAVGTGGLGDPGHGMQKASHSCCPALPNHWRLQVDKGPVCTSSQQFSLVDSDSIRLNERVVLDGTTPIKLPFARPFWIAATRTSDGCHTRGIGGGRFVHRYEPIALGTGARSLLMQLSNPPAGTEILVSLLVTKSIAPTKQIVRCYTSFPTSSSCDLLSSETFRGRVRVLCT